MQHNYTTLHYAKRTFIADTSISIFKAFTTILGQIVKVRSDGIVGQTVVPDAADIGDTIGRRWVLLSFQLAFDGSQIHGFFDNGRIIVQFQTPPIDGFEKGCTIGAEYEGINDFGDALERFLLRCGEGLLWWL